LTRQRPNTTTPKIPKETHLSKQHKHFWGPPARWTCAGRWGWNYKQTNHIVRNPGCFRNGQKKEVHWGVPGSYFDASVCLLKFPGPQVVGVATRILFAVCRVLKIHLHKYSSHTYDVAGSGFLHQEISKAHTSPETGCNERCWSLLT